MNRTTSYFRFSVVMGGILYLGACTNIDFKEPVTSYSSAMSASSAVVADYYNQQNELARKYYFTQLKYDRVGKVKFIEEGGFSTPVYLRYSAEGIKARRDAIDLISAYGNRLAVLAGADFPERVGSSTSGIMTGYDNLSKAFSDLEGQGATYNEKFSKETKNLVAALTKMYAENERNKALTEAIVNGYPASNEILKTLQADIYHFAKLNQARQSTQFQHLAAVYNADVDVKANPPGVVSKKSGKSKSEDLPPTPTPLSESQRVELLGQVQSTAALYEGSVINQPNDVVAAMIQANDALYAYAVNQKSENSLIALNSALETFNARIKPFVAYYVTQR